MVRETTASHRTKSKHRKGLWSPDEDQRLRNYILNYGHGCWSSLPSKAGESLFAFFILIFGGIENNLKWLNLYRA